MIEQLLILLLLIVHLSSIAADEKKGKDPAIAQKELYMNLPFAQPNIFRNRGRRRVSQEQVNMYTIDHFLMRTFKELVQDKWKEDLPWVLAVCDFKRKNDDRDRDYFDAHMINGWLEKHAEHPMEINLTILAVYYFSLEKARKKFTYIGTRQELKKRDPEIVHWYILASKGEDAVTMNNLGAIYSRQCKFKEAEHWYEKAAKEGNSYAMFNRGARYFNQRNYKDAEHWWKMAAEKNDVFASIHLLFMHVMGYLTKPLIDQQIDKFKDNIEKNNKDVEFCKKKYPVRYSVAKVVLQQHDKVEQNYVIHKVEQNHALRNQENNWFSSCMIL